MPQVDELATGQSFMYQSHSPTIAPHKRADINNETTLLAGRWARMKMGMAQRQSWPGAFRDMGRNEAESPEIPLWLHLLTSRVAGMDADGSMTGSDGLVCLLNM